MFIKEQSELTKEIYEEFTLPYADALAAVQVWVDVLNQDCRRRYEKFPIHNVQYRIKKLESVQEKLNRKGFPVTAEAAGNYLTDIAGGRIICYFVEDVYQVVRLLKKRSEVVLIKECDYIREPKENGYRSYHLVIGVPVYHADGKSYYPVEIQVRTIAMDFWASMEHRICYKKIQDSSRKQKLQEYARTLGEMEEYMSQVQAGNEETGAYPGINRIFKV